ncbi:DUF3060 domain-containing protein [Gordonia sp. (in: high G+C Gram-positive bacteria)]|uniref:DUF3060 domain-containing protein n=1 Tax=Gordonia sp. (in: high G+C Gram-positive bacteria) TaxID=84139 RepID=UPI0016AA65D5|nr:DUF3060 domain-containing protein [Gordonia sp. (in: high G+C Gram-positive bacteria)]NLG48207.1 DUF3060 domain-containing protein [Gordonia sp. (in: high G+C Gram-positive bacteria)]
MHIARKSAVFAGAVAAALALAGCGDDGDSAPETVTVTSGPQAEQSPTHDDSKPGDDDGSRHTAANDQTVRITQTPAEVRCTGGDVIVAVPSAQVSITGNCDDVKIESSGGTITAENVDDLDVAGSDNTVTAGLVDDLDVDGDNNTVTAQRIDDVDLNGNDNTVNYREGSPEIDDEGSGNTVGVGG